ncbi:MAG: NlpC/P60 family protein [Acidipropionibacterium sp.]|jgi:cell wall-associated NlpC family hydrolase|nr:NlpC/P60 family protein [Acidipropionibacterium sp.]
MALSGVIVVSGLIGGQSGAAATPDTVSEAKANLDSIQAQTSKIQDNYTKAQADLDKASKSLATVDKDLTAQRAKVEKMRSTLSVLAVNDYQSGGVSLTARLITSGDSTQFLSKLATVQNLNDRTRSEFQTFQSQQAVLQDLEHKAAADKATIKSSRDAQAVLLKQAKAKQGDAQKVLDRLTAQERERLAKAQAAAAAAAEARAAAAVSRSTTRPAAPAGTAGATSTTGAAAAKTATVASGPASGRAATAMAFAMSKVGGPYVYGGTGPTGYDCSGLTQAAWGAAGVSLPRTAAEQFGVGTPVSIGSLQPGDLVFYYSGISHVAMYIGGGRIVHAANPSSGITTGSVGEMPIQGARRVG